MDNEHVGLLYEGNIAQGWETLPQPQPQLSSAPIDYRVLMLAGGFDVHAEARRATLAAMARSDLLGLPGTDTPYAVRVADAAFVRTVVRILGTAGQQAWDAAMAAGDRNPHRAAGVMVPWLLGNIGFSCGRLARGQR